MIETTLFSDLPAKRIVEIHNALAPAADHVTRFSSKTAGLTRLLKLAMAHPDREWTLPVRFPDAFPKANPADKGEAQDAHVVLFLTFRAETVAACETLTDKELAVLRALLTNNFTAGQDWGGATWASTINDAEKPSGIEGRSLSGVVSSLQAKGFITCDHAGKDATIGWKDEATFLRARTLVDQAEDAQALETALVSAPALVQPAGKRIRAAGLAAEKTAKADNDRNDRAAAGREEISGPRTVLKGKRAIIWRMVTQPEGALHTDICKALGWASCAATIGKVARSQGWEVVRTGEGETKRFTVRKPTRRAAA